jgi:site-specific DNA recombinase
MTKMRALYVRVSSDEQARTGHSIENQKARLAAYATAQGWQQTEIYADEGHSAKSMERPAMRRLEKDIRAKKIDAVITLSLDRLSRRLFDILEFIKFLDAHEVAYISVTESFDTSTSIGRLMLHLLGAVAEFERDLITERVTSNLRGIVMRQKRFVSGSPVYGYKHIDKRLTIDSEASSRVLDMVQWFISGWSFRGIAKKLNEENIKSPMGKLWSPQSVKQILSNEALTGVLLYGNGDDAIRIENAHPAIISPDLWEKIQERWARMKKGSGNKRAKYRTSGLVFCSYCGGKMHATTYVTNGYKYRRYVCSTYQHGRGCHHHQVDVDLVEQAAFEFLQIMAEGVPIPQEQMARAREEQEADKVRKLKRLDARMQKQIEAYENDLIGGHDLKLARERIDRERQEIEDTPITDPTPPEGLQTLRDIWDGDIVAVRDGLKQLISKIVVEDRKVKAIVLADFWETS